MSSFDLWLQPLRAYPRGIVLVCFVLMVGWLCWFVAKVLKWSVYSLALLVFAMATGAFVFWLWG